MMAQQRIAEQQRELKRQENIIEMQRKRFEQLMTQGGLPKHALKHSKQSSNFTAQFQHEEPAAEYFQSLHHSSVMKNSDIINIEEPDSP